MVKRDELKMSFCELLEKGICINCKESALPNCYSEDGIKEYYISGFCEKCFDDLFKDEEYSDDEKEL